MSPTYSGPDDALAGARGAGNAIAGQRLVPNTTTPYIAPELRLLRRKRLAAAVHRLAARVVFELLDEPARHYPEIASDVDRRLALYAERLNPGLLRAAGGDRFPAGPMRVIGGGR